VLYAHNRRWHRRPIPAAQSTAAGMKPRTDILITLDRMRTQGAFEAMKAGQMNVSVECTTPCSYRT
jgi:hypothetical protein